MANIAITQPTKAQLDAMPLVANVQFFEPKPASAINRITSGLFPNAIYKNFTVIPKGSGLAVKVLAAGGMALVGTANGESIKVNGQKDIDCNVEVGANYIYLVANFLHDTVTNQVDISSPINPADIIVRQAPSGTGLLLATVNVPVSSTSVTQAMISFDGVSTFSFDDFMSRADFDAHKHDTDYAKKGDVLTPVPPNAVFTDTQRAVINNLTSTSTSASLTANQGRVLKGLIDNINAVLSSDDTTLDELQEVVNFIKQNKATLNTLGVANIAGLQSALNAKQNALGYTPVQQGGGTNQFDNKIKIGWGAQSKLLLEVDETNFGNTWPIVSRDTEKLNGQPASYYAKATDTQTALTAAQAAQSVANSKVTKEEAKIAVSGEGIAQLNINNKHFITENDGGGNFNRRVGHKYENGYVPTEFGGHTAFHEVFGNDVADGSYILKIANEITDDSLITHWRTAFEISYSQFKIWGNALVVNSGGSVHIKGVEYKPAVKHYHFAGNINVNFNEAIKHVVTRFGSGNGTITLSGTVKAGDELVIVNVRDDSGTATITGKTMFTGVGGEGAATHTLTGQAKVTMFGFDGSDRLMIAEVV